MFRMSYDSPCTIQGTIKLKKPVDSLGTVIDIHGVRWNIYGYYSRYDKGKPLQQIVQAVPESQMHPFYTDTSAFSGYGVVSQEWLPYRVEVCNEVVRDNA